MKKGFVIAAVTLIVVGTLLFAAAFFAFGFDFSKMDTAKYETHTYALRDDFESIEIRSDEADILLKRSEDGKLRVDCVEPEKVGHTVFVENGVLKILAADQRAWYDHLTLFAFKNQCVTVYLPPERYDALTIAASTGDVAVPEAFSFGDVQITSDAGDVAFDAATDGSLKIKTNTGDIVMHAVQADTIDLSVSTGRIDSQNTECKKALSVRVSTGESYLTDVVCESLISTGSTGGLTLKNVVATDIFNIERNTGDVRFENCDAGQITVTTSTGDVTGTLRSEKVFFTQTSTGEINVPNTISGGRCTITTSTGDIAVDFVKQ